MTKTTNYQLPKWEKTDRIQMKDFNDMTAKLDAALKANADAASYAPVLLINEMLAESCAEWCIDLSGIDLCQYRKLELQIHLYSASDGGAVYLNCNGDQTEGCHTGTLKTKFNIGDLRGGAGTLILLDCYPLPSSTLFRWTTIQCAYAAAASGAGRYTGAALSQLQKLVLSSEYGTTANRNFHSGCKAVVYGLR